MPRSDTHEAISLSQPSNKIKLDINNNEELKDSHASLADAFNLSFIIEDEYNLGDLTEKPNLEGAKIELNWNGVKFKILFFKECDPFCLLDGVHALNNVLQDFIYSKNDLDIIAKKQNEEFEEGNYDINMLLIALKKSNMVIKTKLQN